MTESWLEQAESLLQRLCPNARQAFEANAPFLSHQTRLAYLLLAEHFWSIHSSSPVLVGIGGGQGAGKSTLVRFVADLIRAEVGMSVQTLSLDDFYLGKAKREWLASAIHPLFVTRGVPGTHDVALLNSVLDRILKGECPLIPAFDKTSDDLLPESRWTKVLAAPDIILLEGWCVGATPQSLDALAKPVNSLEQEKDADGSWRAEVNRRLAADYAELFSRLDELVYLQVPDLNAVRQWRFQQGSGLSEQQVVQFVQYFERLTLWMQQDLPERADAVLALSADHDVKSLCFNKP